MAGRIEVMDTDKARDLACNNGRAVALNIVIKVDKRNDQCATGPNSCCKNRTAKRGRPRSRSCERQLCCPPKPCCPPPAPPCPPPPCPPPPCCPPKPPCPPKPCCPPPPCPPQTCPKCKKRKPPCCPPPPPNKCKPPPNGPPPIYLRGAEVLPCGCLLVYEDLSKLLQQSNATNGKIKSEDSTSASCQTQESTAPSTRPSRVQSKTSHAPSKICVVPSKSKITQSKVAVSPSQTQTVTTSIPTLKQEQQCSTSQTPSQNLSQSNVAVYSSKASQTKVGPSQSKIADDSCSEVSIPPCPDEEETVSVQCQAVPSSRSVRSGTNMKDVVAPSTKSVAKVTSSKALEEECEPEEVEEEQECEPEASVVDVEPSNQESCVPVSVLSAEESQCIEQSLAESQSQFGESASGGLEEGRSEQQSATGTAAVSKSYVEELSQEQGPCYGPRSGEEEGQMSANWAWDKWDTFCSIVNGDPFPDPCVCGNGGASGEEGLMANNQQGANQESSSEMGNGDQGLTCLQDCNQETFLLIVALPLVILGLMSSFTSKGC